MARGGPRRRAAARRSLGADHVVDRTTADPTDVAAGRQVVTPPATTGAALEAITPGASSTVMAKTP